MVVHRWDPALLDRVSAAIGRAAGGRPTVVVIEADAGMGKSGLLDELVDRAGAFVTVRAEGFETSAAVPYAVLARWGVDLTVAQGAKLSPVLAAQRLRELIDRAERTLLVLDDLQWADPESIDVVIDVLTRAAGDPVLLAIGSRPLDAEVLPAWQRWAARPERVERVELTGLGLPEATSLVLDLRPEADPETVQALWQHTGGSPLYLRALVDEYDPSELTGMQVLPAPAAFAATVTTRLSQLPAVSRDVAQAVAVLGTGWVSILDVTELSGISDIDEPIQALLEDGLLQLRRSTPTDTVRLDHALTRAAVYQATPIATRRALHAKAAEIVTGRSAVLDHRVAAAAQYDDELAADLEAYAVEQHAQRSYRLAGHFWSAASALTRQPQERERRWLEALFATLLSGDRAGVRAAADKVAQVADLARRALVEGALALWERRPIDAAAIFAARLGQQSEIEPGTRYRLEILLAWSSLQAGRSSDQIQAALDRAVALEPKDPALRRLSIMSRGQVISRRGDLTEALGLVAQLPSDPASVPSSATDLLAWRGGFAAGSGRFISAIADLGELTNRMQQGLADFSGGAFHALLAEARWFSGDWPRARVNLMLAADLSPAFPHPTATALGPLRAVIDGDVAAADLAVDAARASLARTPWPEAVDLFDVVDVVRQHAAGRADPHSYERLGPTVRALRTGEVTKNVVWLTHAAQAAIWAGELGDAETCVAAIKAAPGRIDWSPPIVDWLLGLTAEARGNGRIAIGHLRAAIAGNASEIPLYQAHLHVDHARLARILGDRTAADRSLDLAGAAYRAIGASAYVDRLDELRQIAPGREGPTIALSDRERDVLTLIADGLSYAQVARDLFITQKTVGYHLGNIYAKANVSSRHQLTDLVRSEPALFGLSPTG